MLKKIQYNKLAQLGITVWQPRAAKHDMLIPSQIRINARCLVLLFSKHAPAQTLDGMLSVLNLPSTQIMRAVVQQTTPNLDTLYAQTQQWQPEFILQLSMEVPVLNKQTCVRTFSPAYLLQNPQHKAQAYKDLLALRAMLHGSTKCNS